MTLTDQEQEELLVSLRPWLRVVASGFTRDPGLREDLAQEGWIAAWRSLTKSSGTNTLSYAKKAATWRMLSVFSDGRALGSARAYGTAVQYVPTPYNAPDADPDDLLPIWESLKYVDEAFDQIEESLSDAVEKAYHYGQIAEAVDGLSEVQRTYVRLRFWEGLSPDEIKDRLGPNVKHYWSNKNGQYGARAELLKKLAHLKEYV